MRIIAGKARGRKLLSPEGMGTRPTLDRIKESIFNIIQGKVSGAKVIDVFAGTGSLGLEAASRGAEKCYLIDKGDVTFSLLKQNIENLKFEDCCEAFRLDSYEALRRFSNNGEIFDLIFIDPPYCKEMIPEAVELITKGNLLKEDGLIVTKIDTIEEIYKGNGIINLYDVRKYGNTTVCFYDFREA